MRSCVFFIVDGRKIEAQACLLAPSLRHHLGEDIHVIGYRRQDAAPLQPITARILAECNVELRDIPGTGPEHSSPWTQPYPIGNKILAASDPRDCDLSVFIDTDMVFSAAVDFAAMLGTAQIGAVISDYSTPSNTVEGWSAFYSHFGLPLPEDRVRLPRGRRTLSLPYFNAGLIIFRENFGGNGRSFGMEWLHDATRFDHEVTYPYTRENIDQLTLPITATRLGQKVASLPVSVNFNLPAYGSAPDIQKALIHYHRFGVLWSHPELGRPVLDILRKRHGAEALTMLIESFPDLLAVMRLGRIS
jgi:hypothetical protein